MSPYVHTTKLSLSTLAVGRSAQGVPAAFVRRLPSAANAKAEVDDLSNARRPSTPVPTGRPITAELLRGCREAPAPGPPARETFLWAERDVNSRESATGYEAFRKARAKYRNVHRWGGRGEG